MSKKYLSVFNDGTNDLYIKDAEAQQAISELQQSVTGAMHYIGVSSTAITDGATSGPWTIDSVEFIPDNGTPTGSQVKLKAGDVAIYSDKEYVWNATAHKWQEFGSTGSLKSLAFKDASDIEVGDATSKKLETASVGSASGWDDGSVSNVSYDENNEKLTFIKGTEASLTVTSTTVATGSVANSDDHGATVVTAASKTIQNKATV